MCWFVFCLDLTICPLIIFYFYLWSYSTTFETLSFFFFFFLLLLKHCRACLFSPVPILLLFSLYFISCFSYILFFYSFAKFCINCYYFFHSILYCFLTFVYSNSSNFLYTLVLLLFPGSLFPGSCDCSTLSPMAVLSCPLWLFYLATCNIDYFIYTHILTIIRTLHSFTVFCLVTFTYFHTAIYILIHLFPPAF